MPGTRAGTGQPISFQCSKCRLENGRIRITGIGRRRGYLDEIELTGKTRPVKHNRESERMTSTHRQYRCKNCGHVGWSRHCDLERLEKRIK